MIAPPEYKAELVTLNKNGGVERLQQVLKLVEQEIKSRGGIFKIVS
jgi:translation initiation factor 2 alpha subunit (eIF-2alpha)